MNSACTSLLYIASKSTPAKKGCDFISLNPSLLPNLVDGFLSKIY